MVRIAAGAQTRVIRWTMAGTGQIAAQYRQAFHVVQPVFRVVDPAAPEKNPLTNDTVFERKYCTRATRRTSR